jgi:hypothetical protein
MITPNGQQVSKCLADICSYCIKVKGFNYFQLNDQCQVQTMQLEFNNIAWGLDIGFQLIWPNGTIQS